MICFGKKKYAIEPSLARILDCGRNVLQDNKIMFSVSYGGSDGHPEPKP